MLATFVLLLMLLADGGSSANLVGKVTSPDGGNVAGAQLMLYSAKSRKNSATQPTRDLFDPAKSVASDTQGEFVIPSIDPSMTYDLLVFADGCRPLILRKIDPANGEIIAKLQKLPDNLDLALAIRGRVTDTDGNPVFGAHAEVQGGKHGKTRWVDSLQDIEKETFTDAKGDFTLICKQPDIQPDVKITAKNLAPMICQFLSPGDIVNPITIVSGASVSGRLIKDGKPVAHLPITLMPDGYRYEITAVESTTVSGDNGTFLFPHVHPDFKYKLFAPMKTAADSGVLAPQPCNVGGDGTAVDLGDVTVETGFTITGQLVCTEENRVPAGASIWLIDNATSDAQQAQAGDDGRFSFKNVPQGVYWVRIDATGLRLSRNNESYYMPRFLKGLIDDDISSLRVEMEPGPADGTTAVTGDRPNQLEKIRLNGVTP